MSVFHKTKQWVQSRCLKSDPSSLLIPSESSVSAESYDTDLRKAIPAPPIKTSQQNTTYILSPPTALDSLLPKKTTLFPQEPMELVKNDSVLETNGKLALILLIGMFLLSISGYWLQKDASEPLLEENSLRVHSVKPGDTLWSLSCFYYGSPYFWKEIFLANQEELRTSGKLLPGMILWIPENPEKITLSPTLPEH